MAAAAVRGALENVAINLESITDAAFAARLHSESASRLAREIARYCRANADR